LDKLLKLDNDLQDKFYTFLEWAYQSNQNKTAQALISLLEANNEVKSDKNISSMLTILKWTNEQEKAFVIDSMKILFARDLKLKTRWGNESALDAMNIHASWWERLKWPSGREFLKYGNLLNELKDIKEEMKEKKWNNYEPNNIFGYTAWYRRNWNSNYNHKNYSITNLGSTDISKEWNYNYIKPIEKNKEKALKWFTDNFDKDQAEKSIFKENISKLVWSIADGYGIKNEADRQKLTQIDIIPLLNWQNQVFELADGTKITISIEAIPVFYLLEACANESVWVDIKDISVTIESVGKFYTNTPETRSTVHVKDRQERNAGISFQKKQAPKNTGNAWDEVTSQSPTGNSGDNITDVPPAWGPTPIENPTDWS
jgi:hypothetical protein